MEVGHLTVYWNHRTMSTYTSLTYHIIFKDEFLAILKRHNIDYDLKYVFETEHVG
jgi:hypothetical protein